MIEIDGKKEARKADIRLYTYAGNILLTAARLYQDKPLISAHRRRLCTSVQRVTPTSARSPSRGRSHRITGFLNIYQMHSIATGATCNQPSLIYRSYGFDVVATWLGAIIASNIVGLDN
jgi:hypothetical protein